MNKLMTGLCCLILAVSPLAMAQDKSADKKAAPVSKKEMNDRKNADIAKMGRCSNDARLKNLKQGTREHHQFMSKCLSPGT